MTSITKLEAIEKKFPFLKEHISMELRMQYPEQAFTVDFSAYKPSVFLAKKKNVCLYNSLGACILTTTGEKTLEWEIQELYAKGNQGIYYIVRGKENGLEVFIPYFGWTSTYEAMTEMLKRERETAAEELEETLRKCSASQFEMKKRKVSSHDDNARMAYNA